MHSRANYSGVKKKWILATVLGSKEKGPSLAHAVVMQHADRGVLDQFLSDLERDRKSAGGSFPTFLVAITTRLRKPSGG